MAEIIPLQPVPSQVVTTTLANQNCRIELRQMATGLYMNLYVNDGLIIGGVLCENLNRIVRNAYLGFDGDFAFIDNEGSENPYYSGLGTRWQLGYLPAAEIADDAE